MKTKFVLIIAFFTLLLSTRIKAQCDSMEVEYCINGQDWEEDTTLTTTCFDQDGKILKVYTEYIPLNTYHNFDSLNYVYDSLANLLSVTSTERISPERYLYTYYPNNLVSSFRDQKMYAATWYDQMRIFYWYYPDNKLSQTIRQGSSWNSGTAPLLDSLIENYYYDASGNDTLTTRQGPYSGSGTCEKHHRKFVNGNITFQQNERWTHGFLTLLSADKDTFIYNSSGKLIDSYIGYTVNYTQGYHTRNTYIQDTLLTSSYEYENEEMWDYRRLYNYNNQGLLSHVTYSCIPCGDVDADYEYDVYNTLSEAYYSSNTFSGEFPEFSDCTYFHYGIKGPSILCDSNSIVLSVSEGEYYLWNTGETTQTITVDTAGTYQCRITLWDGRVYMTAPKKIITGSSHIFALSIPLSLPQCNNLPLHLQVDYKPLTSYDWYRNDSLVLSSYNIYGTNHLYISQGQYGNGNYYAVAKNFCGVDTSSIFIVSSKQARPANITALGPTHFCEGSSVNLRSDPATSYLWKPGYLTTQQIMVSTTGDYLLFAYDTNGCFSIDTIHIVMDHAPFNAPVISRAANYLKAQMYYSPCQWYLNGVAIPGAVNYTYTPTQNGSYKVEFVSATPACSKMSAPFNYVANALQIDIGSPQISVCRNTLSISSIGLNKDPFTGAPNYSYQWKPASFVTNPTSRITTFNSNAVTGWYVLTVTDGVGQIAKDSVLVTIKTPALPPVIIPMDSVYCISGIDQKLKTNYPNALQYSWINLKDPSFTYPNSTMYVGGNDTFQVKILDSNFCMTEFSAPYFVEAKDTNKHYPLNIYASGASLSCGGSGLTLSTDPWPGYTFYWTYGAIGNIIANSNTSTIAANQVNATKFSVFGIDSNGCETSSYLYTLDTGKVWFNIQSPLGTKFCDVDSVPLIANYFPGYTYNWANFPGMDTSKVVTNNFGVHNLTISNGAGCTGSASITIGYKGKPEVEILARNPNLFAFSYDNISTYQWCFDSIPVSGANSIAFPLTAQGLYSVITNKVGECADTSYFNFECDVSLSKKAVANCLDSCAGKIYATPQGMPPFAYKWNNFPVLKYVNNVCPGNYVMQLTDYYGCVISDSVKFDSPVPTVLFDSIVGPGCVGCSDGEIYFSSQSPLAYAVLQPTQDTSFSNSFSLLSANTYVLCLTSTFGCTTCDTLVLQNPLGINQHEINIISLEIYPNPVTDLVTISANKDIEEINILDLQGRLIEHSTPKFSRLSSFELKETAEGIYFAKCKFKDGKTLFRKFVVSH